ncbi:MAG: glycosyltransferase [Rhizobiaceae bacterium]|nr:glycosyltransferase [Rhizobiaceae bacterium]
MHLLFVTSLVPDGQPSTGYEIANAAIIDGLRRVGAKVTVLGFTWPDGRPLEPESTVVLGQVDVRTDSASGVQKLRWLGHAVATGLTFSSVKLRAVTREAVREAIRSVGPFDAYVLNAVPLAGAFEDVFTDRPQIFVAHNVEHRSAAENAAAAKSLVERLMFQREARLLEALERRLCARAAFVFTLANEDISALGLGGSGRALALPLVTRAHAPEPSVLPIAHDLALIGTWTWQPNRIGLEWFLSEVRPRLDPSISVAVAGGTPADLASAWPDVRFLGRVPDAVDFVKSAAVIPLVSRAGTGVQLKTLETFELGMPSVATPRSIRGIADIPANCTVADDPAQFALAVDAAVVRARSGDRMLLDGRAFHAAQAHRLDAALAEGLQALASRLENKARSAA